MVDLPGFDELLDHAHLQEERRARIGS